MQQQQPRAKLQVHVSNNRDRIRKNLMNNLFTTNSQHTHTPRFPQLMKSEQSTNDISQDSKSSPKTVKRVQMFVDVGQNFEQIYQLGKTIGQGAHAIVKLAHKISNPNRIYAVKIFRTSDPEVITTIRRTYQIGRMLNHENIVQMKDLFINESNGYSHLLMNYLPFPSLQNKLHIFKGNEELTRALISKLTQTVVHMHHYGVCHRDLKPDNILVQITQHNGKLILEKMVIIDLGVSKKFKVVGPGGMEPQLKEMWTSTGTQVYCAPEIFQGGGYSQKIDVWAIGIIMYQCLTGTLPFKEETILDTIDKILYQSVSYSSTSIDLSKLAKRLISILLTKDPKIRPRAKVVQKDLWFNISPSMKISRDDISINNKIENSSLFSKNLTQSTNMDEKQIQDHLIQNIEFPQTHLSSDKSENDIFKIKQSEEIYQKLQ